MPMQIPPHIAHHVARRHVQLSVSRGSQRFLPVAALP